MMVSIGFVQEWNILLCVDRMEPEISMIVLVECQNI